jgi:hypothetical protein
MSDNVFTFPGNKTSDRPYQHRRSARKPYRRSEKSMHTVVFRSRETILQADEAELVRDVRFDVDKAQRKLEKIRERFEILQEWAATELQMLSDADNKLSAAIVAALLSGRIGGPHE